jgi:4-hydroxybenzoate polyprenyltransferase
MRTARALVALARPKGSVGLLVVPLTGYGFTHWDHSLDARRPGALAVVLVAWVLLSAGSLWLNAALDGDEGAVLFSGGPATLAPRTLVAWGFAALLSACALAFAADPGAGACCAACAVLAVLYSHPRTRWKAHPVLGPLVNAVGYGVLSWLAGFSVVGAPMSARTAAAMILLTIFALGMCFAAQAYQRDDDARRGYRTLVVVRGPAACLRVASVAAWTSVVGVAILAAAGVYPRLVLAGIPAFVFAERTMARWRREPRGGTPALAAQFAVRMLGGGIVLVALAAVDALR